MESLVGRDGIFNVSWKGQVSISKFWKIWRAEGTWEQVLMASCVFLTGVLALLEELPTQDQQMESILTHNSPSDREPFSAKPTRNS